MEHLPIKSIFLFLLIISGCNKNDQADLGKVRTDSASDVTHISALVHCTITDLGNSYILQKGICWDHSPNPTINNSVFDSKMPSDASFQVPMSLLEPNKVYYVKSYIRTQGGISYGNQIEVKTKSIEYITDTRDNQKYPIISIGEQVWMASNLNYRSNSQTYFFQNDSLKYAATYGRLYDWETACKVCPQGWHLPSDDEWKKLESNLGMPISELDKILNRGTEEASLLKIPNFSQLFDLNLSNKTGFSAMPAGNYSLNGNQFSPINVEATFWTSTPVNSELVWSRKLEDKNNQILRINSGRKNIFQSVRCIKN